MLRHGGDGVVERDTRVVDEDVDAEPAGEGERQDPRPGACAPSGVPTSACTASALTPCVVSSWVARRAASEGRRGGRVVQHDIGALGGEVGGDGRTNACGREQEVHVSDLDHVETMRSDYIQERREVGKGREKEGEKLYLVSHQSLWQACPRADGTL